MKGKEILNRLDHIPEPTDYPTADGIILEDILRYRLHSDGRIDRYHYRFKRILTDFDRDKYSDMHVLFNLAKQDVNILSLATIMRDGSIKETPEYGINQITPAFLEKAPDFTDFQQRILSHVGAERHGYSEIEYEIIDREAWLPEFSGTIDLRGDIPFLTRTIVIETPADAGIECTIVKMATPPEAEVTTTDGKRIVTFTFGELPLWDIEDNHALAKADCPQLVFGLKRTIADLAAQLHAIVEHKAQPDALIQKKVRNLISDLECPVMKCHKLHTFITQGIASIAFDPIHTGFTSRRAADVLRTGYGTFLEKALLLYAMIRETGQPATVALSCPQPAYPVGHALHLGVFDTAWVHVPLFDDWLCPDRALKEARREFLEGSIVLLAKESGGNAITIDNPGREPGNRFDAKLALKLKADGAGEGTLDASMVGIYNPYFGLFDEESDEVTGWVKGFAGKFWIELEVDKHHFRNFASTHSILAAGVKTKAWKEDAERRVTIQFPEAISKIGGFSIPSYMTERMSTFALPGSLTHTVSIRFEIPSGWKIDRIPGEVHLENTVGTFSQLVETKKENAKPTQVTFTQKLQFTGKFVTPNSWSELREIVLADARPHTGALLLVRE